MSNVCLATAIQTLCRARTSSTLPARQLFCGFARSTRHITRCTAIAETTRSAKTPRCLELARTRFTYARTAIRYQHGVRSPYSTRPDPEHKSAALEPAQPTHTDQSVVEDNGSALPDARIEEGTTDAEHSVEYTEYMDEWQDYDEAGGLPLPYGELDQPAIDAIFGEKTVGTHIGNYVLCVMHWRRMSGSLIDVGVQFPPESSIPQWMGVRALDYLRETYPDVNEERRAGRWVRLERQKLRRTLNARAVKLKLYKPLTDEQKEALAEIEEDELAEFGQVRPGTAYGRIRNEESALDGLRAANEARAEAEDDAANVRLGHKTRSLLAAARGPLELAGGLQQQVAVKRYGNYDVVLLPTATAALALREPPAWVKYYQDRAEILKDEVAPEMSLAQRIIPSLLVFLLTLSGCYYLGTHYTPPSTDARLFPSVAPSLATIGTITAILTGMFLMGRIPPFWRTLNKYFTMVPAYPYPASLLGAMVRHDTFGHLFNNVVLLWMIGLTLHEDIGRGWFLATFIASGATASMSALIYHALAKNWSIYIFGASGALYGILSTLCVLRPQGSVHLFGYEIPFAAWAVLAFVGASQIRGVLATRRMLDNNDYVGHLSGLLTGGAIGFALRSRFRNEKGIAQQEQEIDHAAPPDEGQ